MGQSAAEEAVKATEVKERPVEATLEEGKLYQIGDRVMRAVRVVTAPHQAKVWLVPA